MFQQAVEIIPRKVRVPLLLCKPLNHRQGCNPGFPIQLEPEYSRQNGQLPVDGTVFNFFLPGSLVLPQLGDPYVLQGTILPEVLNQTVNRVQVSLRACLGRPIWYSLIASIKVGSSPGKGRANSVWQGPSFVFVCPDNPCLASLVQAVKTENPESALHVLLNPLGFCRISALRIQSPSRSFFH